MPLRYVSSDRPRRIAWSPKGETIMLVNQDGDTDVYIGRTEEELLNAATSNIVAPSNNLNLGVKMAANGGNINYVDYPGELWAIASGFATPVGGGNAVAGKTFTYIRVVPG